MKAAFLVFAAAAAAFSLSAQIPPSADPVPRNVEYSWMSIADWYRQHADDVEIAAQGEGEVVFLGDSITQGWQWAPSWKSAFATYQPANFGIGGDKTQNLLWRLQNGASGQLDPKVAVLLIGVNNFGHDNASPSEVFAGINANVRQIKASFPNAKILLLGVFPYEEKADHPNRERVTRLNRMVETLSDDTVTVLDIGQIFLEPDGSISKEIMADFLHPTEKGYERLTQTVAPLIADLRAQ